MFSDGTIKHRLLVLKEIFEQETDEKNQLTMKQIISKLEKSGIKAERKTIYKDIELLQNLGLDIVKNYGSNYTYYLGERDFQLAEIKILSDIIASSRFITESKSRRLIDKLCSLRSRYDANEIKKDTVLTNRPKNINQNIFYEIDKIHEAIKTRKQITFQYMTCVFHKGDEIYRNVIDKERILSPICLIWENNTYYLICRKENLPDKPFRTYRVDKIKNIKIVSNDIPKDIAYVDPVKYSKNVFAMYSGKEYRVVLQVEEQLLGQMVDKFGNDIKIIRTPDVKSKNGVPTFKLMIDVNVSPTFFGWLFYFTNSVEILEPTEVIEEYKRRLEETKDMYG